MLAGTGWNWKITVAQKENYFFYTMFYLTYYD
jgi:hypothetical protein